MALFAQTAFSVPTSIPRQYDETKVIELEWNDNYPRAHEHNALTRRIWTAHGYQHRAIDIGALAPVRGTVPVAQVGHDAATEDVRDKLRQEDENAPEPVEDGTGYKTKKLVIIFYAGNSAMERAAPSRKFRLKGVSTAQLGPRREIDLTSIEKLARDEMYRCDVLCWFPCSNADCDGLSPLHLADHHPKAHLKTMETMAPCAGILPTPWDDMYMRRVYLELMSRFAATQWKLEEMNAEYEAEANRLNKDDYPSRAYDRQRRMNEFEFFNYERGPVRRWNQTYRRFNYGERMVVNEDWKVRYSRRDCGSRPVVFDAYRPDVNQASLNLM